MKIVALIPIKNESWILERSLLAIKKLVDEIIIMDDGSTDRSIEISESFGAKVYKWDNVRDTYFSEYKVREKLLELGRLNGGTHFVCIDADEMFDAGLDREIFKSELARMRPGQKMLFKWIPLWKTANQYVLDKKGPLGEVYKDFIYCDDKISSYTYRYIGVSRTPGIHSRDFIRSDLTVVLHFQYVGWSRNQYKQAWYRCSEYINGNRSARRINATYSHLLESRHNIINTPTNWIDHTRNLKDSTLKESHIWYRDKILGLFEQYGVDYFEPLEIWHLKDLSDIYIKKMNRRPKSKVFPKIVLRINHLKNEIMKRFNA